MDRKGRIGENNKLPQELTEGTEKCVPQWREGAKKKNEKRNSPCVLSETIAIIAVKNVPRRREVAKKKNLKVLRKAPCVLSETVAIIPVKMSREGAKAQRKKTKKAKGRKTLRSQRNR